jgi:rhodanese-related sulfurtransferase
MKSNKWLARSIPACTLFALSGPFGCTHEQGGRPLQTSVQPAQAAADGSAATEPLMSQTNITPQEAKRLLDSHQATYLDVRTVREYESARPAGSINIPVIEMDAAGNRAQNTAFVRVVEANFAKDTPLVVGCQSGGRSSMAAQMLRQAGYTRVYNMMGGFGGGRSTTGEEIPGWSELGYPTEQGPAGDQAYEQLKKKSGP